MTTAFSHLRYSVLILTAIMLSACGTPPEESDFLNRGGPESLLDSSREVVDLYVSSAIGIEELSDWLDRDRPTSAQLNCASKGKYCADARKILELQGVPVTIGNGKDGSVTLVYERVTVRDCDSSYVDNAPNPYNTNHPNFGCSVASNIISHVGDKQQLVRPGSLDKPNATRGVNDMVRAYKPRPIVTPYSVEQALTSSATSN